MKRRWIWGVLVGWLALVVVAAYAATLDSRTGLNIPQKGDVNWDTNVNAWLTKLGTKGAFSDLTLTYTARQTFPDLGITGTGIGDMLVGTASGVMSRLPAGGTNLPLVADSSSPNGVRWGGKGVTMIAPVGIGLNNFGEADFRIGSATPIVPNNGISNARMVLAGRVPGWAANQRVESASTTISTGCVGGSTPGQWCNATLLCGGGGTCTGTPDAVHANPTNGTIWTVSTAGTTGATQPVCNGVGTNCWPKAWTPGATYNPGDRVKSMYTAVFKICAAGSNAHRSCNVDGDCPSSTCIPQDRQYRMSGGAACKSGLVAPAGSATVPAYAFGNTPIGIYGGACSGGANAGRCCQPGACTGGANAGAPCTQNSDCSSNVCTTPECPSSFCAATPVGCTITAANGGLDGTCQWTEDGQWTKTVTDGTATWSYLDIERSKDIIQIDATNTTRGHILVRNYDNDLGCMFGDMGSTATDASNPQGAHPAPRWCAKGADYRSPDTQFYIGGLALGGPVLAVHRTLPSVLDPTAPPSVTAAASGSLGAGCWAVTYTWENNSNAQRTVYAPPAYVWVDGSTNKSVSVTLPAFPSGVSRAQVFMNQTGEIQANCFTGVSTWDPATYIRYATMSTVGPTTISAYDGEHEGPPAINQTASTIFAINDADPFPWTPSTTFTVSVSTAIRPTYTYRVNSIAQYGHKFIPYSNTSGVTAVGTTCVSGSTEPAWNTGGGATTDDGTCRWKEIGDDQPVMLLRPVSNNADIFQVRSSNGSDVIVSAMQNDGRLNIGHSHFVPNSHGWIGAGLGAADPIRAGVDVRGDDRGYQGTCSGGTAPGQPCNICLGGGTCVSNSCSGGTNAGTACGQCTGGGTCGGQNLMAGLRISNIAPGGDANGYGWQVGATGTVTSAGGFGLVKFSTTGAGSSLMNFDTSGNVLINGGAIQLAGQLNVLTGDLALANGDNNNVSAVGRMFIRITGPTGAFAITGLVAPSQTATAQMVILRSTVSQTLTIKRENASSTAANRIETLTGADIVCTATEPAAVTLVYDTTTQRWIVTSVMNCPTV